MLIRGHGFRFLSGFGVVLSSTFSLRLGRLRAVGFGILGLGFWGFLRALGAGRLRFR